ncbi:MAG: V-type ATPase subunit [Thermoplasmata archaeon]
MQGLISYAYAYARCKALENNLLNSEIYENMLNAQNVQQIINILLETRYKDLISFFSTKYSGTDLIEVSTNSSIVNLSKIALSITPRIGLDSLRAYISKWDINNIKIIISSKALGRPIKETEIFLISERDLPAGLFAGILKPEDYRLMIEENDIESIVKYLLKFPYGKILMEGLDSYRKNGDIGEMLLLLDLFYFKNLKEKVKIYIGNEMPVIHLISSQIDVKNIMTLIRGFELGIPTLDLRNYIIEGGNIQKNKMDEMLQSSNIDELVEKIKDVYDLSKALNNYHLNHDIKDFEIELERYIFERNISSFRIASPGLSSIIGMLLMFETERENIRKISYGKYFGLSQERIRSMLIKVV